MLEDDVIPRNQHHRVPTNQKNHFDQIDKVRSAIILDLHKDGTFYKFHNLHNTPHGHVGRDNIEEAMVEYKKNGIQCELFTFANSHVHIY